MDKQPEIVTNALCVLHKNAIHTTMPRSINNRRNYEGVNFHPDSHAIKFMLRKKLVQKEKKEKVESRTWWGKKETTIKTTWVSDGYEYFLYVDEHVYKIQEEQYNAFMERRKQVFEELEDQKLKNLEEAVQNMCNDE